MMKVIMAAAGVLSLLSASSAAAEPSTAPDLQRETLVWQDCGDGLQCAGLPVPADWSRPAGTKINLGLAKLPARDQQRKQGSLVLNLGGPAQQISIFRQVTSRFTDLTQWYDLVVMDPRGFEASSGISCPEPAPMWPEFVHPDQRTYQAYQAENRRFGQRCTEAAGPLAGTLDSWQVARDLDATRAALGQRRLNYFGNSYGTMFAQAYAEFFPHRVGRMYLDSVIDHSTRSVRDWLLPRARTLEHNLHRFAAWCGREPSCVLHGRDVIGVWDRMIAMAERAPIPAPGAGPGATASVTRIISRTGATFEPVWPELAREIAEAAAGDASRFAAPPRGGRDPDLSRIMFCADFPYPTDYSELKALETELRQVAPRLGWRNAWPMANHCGGLPATRTFRQHPIHPKGMPPVLLTNGEYDDTTPQRDGQRVAAQFPGSRFLPAQGGHALYFSGNACVRQHANRYLSTGELPPAGAACVAG